MTYAELINVVLSFHSAILLVALTAYFKYGDRSQIFAKSLQGASAALEVIRKGITLELVGAIKPILRSSDSVTSTILGPDDAYFEKAIDMLDGEEFRDGVREFVERRANSIADCRSLTIARDRWCRWAERLSKGILFLLIWQSLSFIVAGSGKFLTTIPLSILKGSLVVSIGSVLVCLGLLVPVQSFHNRIMDLRRKYDVL